MAARFTPTIEQVDQAYEAGLGFCRSCGKERRGVDPDAQHLQCACGALEVHGANQYIQNAWVS